MVFPDEHLEKSKLDCKVEMKLSPVVLFTYNRLEHTRRTVEALLLNELAADTDLIVYSDAPKNSAAEQAVNDVREYLNSISGFSSVRVIKREKNFGLGKNIIAGVTDVLNERGRAIILEDDLLTSPFFLRFMNDALDKYENHDRVISVVGYLYPVETTLSETFFIRGSDCLGWGTWKRAWDLFESDAQALLSSLEAAGLCREFDYNNNYPYTQMLRDQAEGKVDSWAVRWYATAFVQNKLTLFPGKSLVYHNGNDGSGTNVADKDDLLDVSLYQHSINVKDIPVEESTAGRKAFEKFFQKKYKRTFLNKVMSRLQRGFRSTKKV